MSFGDILLIIRINAFASHSLSFTCSLAWHSISRQSLVQLVFMAALSRSLAPPRTYRVSALLATDECLEYLFQFCKRHHSTKDSEIKPNNNIHACYCFEKYNGHASSPNEHTKPTASHMDFVSEYNKRRNAFSFLWVSRMLTFDRILWNILQLSIVARILKAK